jgi:predicted acetyltransferase
MLQDQSAGLNLPEGFVPATMFWFIDNEELIGRLQIRHELTPFLLKHGGHIGYYIKPSKRNLGYGNKILSLGLQEARKIGLKKVLITCDEDNSGSRKIIESNGGVQENSIETEKGKPKTLRYWINLNK